MIAYTEPKSRSQFSVAPVQDNKLLLFVQSDSDQLSITAKKADGTFVSLSSGVSQKAVKDTALIYALVFG